MVFASFGTSAQQPGAPSLSPNRVILRVADLDASVRFYRNLVGLPLQRTFDNEFAEFGNGGLTIMLQQVTRKSTGPSTGLSAITELVFDSPDILESYKTMKARGVDFPHPPRIATDGDGKDLFTADFRDPDGHVLSIAGWVARR
jgi:catechol 2,3-dioxygenase-like lactoylglutathione lyase family enzyme